jgi:hypothetical protein
MKKLIITLVIKSAVAISVVGQVHANLDDLSWLEGKWMRTNVRADRTAFEPWQRQSTGTFTGVGATLREGDTVNVERLKIVARGDSLYYVADVPENPNPVYFAFTEMSSASFTCENPNHDFPKKIRYVLAEGVLTATISGGGKPVTFTFRKE